MATLFPTLPFLTALASPSLLLLQERGARLGEPLTICLGKKPDVPRDRAYLLVGDCAQVKGESNYVRGCPPDRKAVFSHLSRHIA